MGESRETSQNEESILLTLWRWFWHFDLSKNDNFREIPSFYQVANPEIPVFSGGIQNCFRVSDLISSIQNSLHIHLCNLANAVLSYEFLSCTYPWFGVAGTLRCLF